MKHTGSKCVQDNHLPDIRLNYPYGTVSNKDNWEELPLYLRKARNTKLRTGEDTTALKPYQMADPNNLRSGNTSSTQSETHHNKKHFPQGPGADFDRQLMSRNVIPNQTQDNGNYGQGSRKMQNSVSQYPKVTVGMSMATDMDQRRMDEHIRKYNKDLGAVDSKKRELEKRVNALYKNDKENIDQDYDAMEEDEMNDNRKIQDGNIKDNVNIQNEIDDLERERIRLYKMRLDKESNTRGAVDNLREKRREQEPIQNYVQLADGYGQTYLPRKEIVNNSSNMMSAIRQPAATIESKYIRNHNKIGHIQNYDGSRMNNMANSAKHKNHNQNSYNSPPQEDPSIYRQSAQRFWDRDHREYDDNQLDAREKDLKMLDDREKEIRELELKELELARIENEILEDRVNLENDQRRQRELEEQTHEHTFGYKQDPEAVYAARLEELKNKEAMERQVDQIDQKNDQRRQRELEEQTNNHRFQYQKNPVAVNAAKL